MHDHLSDSDIATLLTGQTSEAVEAHLLTCRECSLLHEASGVAYSEDLRRGRTHRLVLQKRSWLAGASGLAAAAAALVLLLWHPWAAPSLDFREALPAELHVGIEAICGQWMVFPGFEDIADRERPLSRAHDVATTEFEVLVAAELKRVQSGAGSAKDFMRVVAALLADGEVATARRWVEQGVADFPDDARLRFLNAAALQRAGDLAEATRTLASLCDDGNGNPTFCLDYAIVLGQLGRAADAAEAVGWLREGGADEKLIARGEIVLEKLWR